MTSLLWVGGCASLMMMGLWLVQRRTQDAGIVDVGWTLGIGFAAVFLAVDGTGYGARRLLLAALVSAWSLRLAAYIFLDRLRGAHEDRRYRRLREHWGPHAQRNFFLFFQFQALLIVVCALPAFAVAANGVAPLSLWDALGAAVFLTSIMGEALADRQLRRFRADPAHQGRTCRQGLWRYSRHPNYFFEWLHWWGYVLFAVGSPLWGVTLVGPTLMLLFLFKITGIPATEAQALRSRGEDYRRYQQSTSMFIPWFPRKESL